MKGIFSKLNVYKLQENMLRNYDCCALFEAMKQCDIGFGGGGDYVEVYT